MMNGLTKALAHLSHALGGGSADRDERVKADETPSSTPHWHGDHWQNLLACPMDARRYILEDWTQAFERFDGADDEARIDSFSGRPIRHYN